MPLLVAALATAAGAPVADAAAKWKQVNVSTVDAGGGSVVAGRINAAVSDPKDPNVMYIATDGARPAGLDGDPDGGTGIGLPDTGGAGVWKTKNWLDPAPIWTPLTDKMPSPSIGVNGLAMARTNRHVLYAAADGPQGTILKTKDGGKHWQALGGTRFSSVKFGGLAIDPADEDIVYVAVFRGSSSTPGGVYKSADGGDVWALVGDMGEASHVVIDPSNAQTLYAGFVDPSRPAQQGLWKSADGGGSWQQQNANFPAGTFGGSVLYIELAIAPSAHQILYAVVMQPAANPLPAFYSTPDGGAHWNQICPTATDPPPDNRYWHQPLAIHPQNPLIVYAEGVNHDAVFTTTGGQQAEPGPVCAGAWTTFWTNDDPAGFTFYDDPTSSGGIAAAAFGDRGIYRVVDTTDPDEHTTFTHKQGLGLSNVLLVSIAVDQDDPSTIYGIAVDQLGGMVTTADTQPLWSYVSSGGNNIGAEFGKFLFNPGNSSIVYNLCPVGDEFCDPNTFINRLAGGVWTSIANGFTSANFPFARSVQTNAAAWRAIEFDPITSEGLLYGGTQIWAWTGATNTFTAISPNLVNSAPQTTSYISAIGIAPSQAEHVYVGTSEGTLYFTKNRQQWNPVTTLSLPPAAFVPRIVVDPVHKRRVVVVVQGTTGPGRVWITTTAGATWTDLTGNLPEGLQAYTLAVDWRSAGPDLYVGTDRGVYQAENAEPRWRLFGHDFPATLVSDLQITPSNVLTAATYGRGVFQIRLPKPN